MAPLKYGDFVKDAENLLNNDFCFDRKFKVKTKSKNGFSLTTEGTLGSSGKSVSGKLTTGFSLGNGITINKLGVSHAGRFFADASYNNVFDGCSLTTVVEDGGKKSPVGEIGLTYKHELATLTTKVDAINGPTIKETLSTHYDNFVVGGEFKYNTGFDGDKGAGLKDYNLGVAYKDADFTVAATTLKSLSSFKVAVHHNVSKGVQVGAVYNHGSDSKLSFGGKYKLDNSTTFQGKVNSNGVMSLNAHQQLTPSVKLIASAEVNTVSLAEDSHKFGLQMLLS